MILLGHAFCDLSNLSDDWGLLNLMTGGSHDRGENDPAARADDPLGPLLRNPCRAMEDMRIHGMDEKAQKAHIRAVKDFALFLGRSPDTATPDDLRAYQLHMTDTGVTPPTYNARIMALRFLFGKEATVPAQPDMQGADLAERIRSAAWSPVKGEVRPLSAAARHDRHDDAVRRDPDHLRPRNQRCNQRHRQDRVHAQPTQHGNDPDEKREHGPSRACRSPSRHRQLNGANATWSCAAPWRRPREWVLSAVRPRMNFFDSVFSNVDFPTPDDPTRATVCPGPHQGANVSAASGAFAFNMTTSNPS